VDIDFESGAKALASLLEREAGEPLRARGKPFADGVEGRGRDDSGAVGDGIVRETVGGITNDNLLFKKDAEPFGGVFVGIWEGKSARRNAATITGNGESDGTEIRGVIGANEMDGRSTLAVDPLAVGGVESPGAVKGESAAGADASFGNGNRIDSLNRMEANER